jgi:hypothetical protein
MGQRNTRLGLITEVGSAIAVVVSLVFVGLEVRETARQTELNTEAIRIAAYQDLISQISSINELVLEPEAAAAYAHLSSPDTDWGTLSDEEQARVTRIFFLLVRHADMAYYQFEKGLLPEDRLESALRPFTGSLQAPVHSQQWERWKGFFVPSFRDYIDSVYLAP